MLTIERLRAAPQCVAVAVLTAAYAGVAATSVAQQPATSAAAPVAEAATGEQIARWVEQLDDERFGVRQRAEEQLAAVGPGALEAVAAAARDSALERSTRAVRILLAWTETGDAEHRLAVLERLAAARDTHPTEAGFAAEQTFAVREAAALEALTALGAVHNLETLGHPARRYAPVHVIIGPNWTGGDDGLAALADVRRLTTLSLHSAPITAEGVRQAKSLPGLRRLEVYGTPHTPEVLAEIKAALPELTEIAVRSGAQLGIQGDADPNQAVAFIEKVYPDTAAHRAGMLAHDIVTAVDDDKVGNFMSLTEKIAQYQPGDTVTVTVQRNGEELKLPVKFDRWGENEDFTLANIRANQRPIAVRVNGGGVIIQGNRRIVVPPARPAAPRQPR